MTKRFFAVFLMCVLLSVSCSRVRAEGGFSAYVKSSVARVYSDAKLKRRVGELSKYSIVSVLDYQSGVALITYQGNSGYMRVRDLATVASAAKSVILDIRVRVYKTPSLTAASVEVSPGTQVFVLKTNSEWAMIEKSGNIAYLPIGDLPREESEEKSDVVYESFEAQVTAKSLTVYASASKKAKPLGVLHKDDIVNVQAHTKQWARVERDGNVGFCLVSGLTRHIDPYAYLNDPDDTSEHIIYMFLRREMKLNAAAACGVLANIKYESGYRVDAVGDSGRSYGICQWFSMRKTRLMNFCENRQYDFTTLAGQLWFLKYELETYYPKVLNVLYYAPDSADGAYEAAFSFCYDYEGPANRDRLSVTRGNYAKTTVWSRYADE